MSAHIDAPPEVGPELTELADQYLATAARISATRRRLNASIDRHREQGGRLKALARGRVLVRHGQAIVVTGDPEGRPTIYPAVDLDHLADEAELARAIRRAAADAGRDDPWGLRRLAHFVELASDASEVEARGVALEVGRLGFEGTSADFAELVGRILCRDRGEAVPPPERFPRIGTGHPDGLAVLDPRD